MNKVKLRPSLAEVTARSIRVSRRFVSLLLLVRAFTAGLSNEPVGSVVIRTVKEE